MDSNAIAVAFGKVLRKLRIEAELTQEQLGLEADLQRNYISELELGQKQPSVSTLFKLTSALGVKPAKFVTLMDVDLDND